MAVGIVISKRLVLINSVGSVVTRMLNLSVLVWLNQYLLSRISQEEFSIYPVVLAVILFVPLMSSVLTSGVSRYIIEAYAQGDERRITQIVSTMLPVTMAASVVVLIGGSLFTLNVEHILNIPPGREWDARVMLFLLLIMTAIEIPMLLLNCGLQVRQKFILQNLVFVATELLRSGLLFAFLLGINTRVLWVVVSTVIAQLVRHAICFVLSRRLVPAIRFVRGEIRWGYVRQLTSFGLWVFIVQVSEALRTAMTPFVLNKLATPSDVTCYHLGSLAMSQVQSMSTLASAPLQPALTAMHATQRQDRLRSAYLRGGRYALWMVMLIAAPLIIYRREVILLYVGPEFLTSATVMGLLLVVFPITYGHTMLARLAIATAEMGPMARRVLFQQVASLALMLYLVGVLKMGAVGAAWSVALVTLVLYPPLLWTLGLKVAQARFGAWLYETLWLGMLPCLGAVPVWLLLKQTVVLDSWLALGAVTLAGSLVYFALIFLFCLQPYERADLRRVQEGVWRRLNVFGSKERPTHG